MSDTPEKDEIVRSSIITGSLMVVFIVVGVLFWYWSTIDATTIVTTLNDINPFLAPIIEVFTMFGFFVFFVVTIANLRHYVTGVRAGWLEIIVSLILVTALTWVMFTPTAAAVTLVLSLGFVVYLYLLQE